MLMSIFWAQSSLCKKILSFLGNLIKFVKHFPVQRKKEDPDLNVIILDLDLRCHIIIEES